VRQKLTLVTAVCSLLLLPATSVRAQGTRYPQPPSPLGSLPNPQPQPFPQPRPAPLAETISVLELSISEKAVKEFQHSMKAYQSGDYRSSVKHLEKATKIAPTFIAAYNNLGVSYINLHEYDSAALQFQKAIDLAPQLERPYHNLGLALFLLNRFPEAEAVTRHALELAPKESSTRFMLGRILAMDGNNPTEAVEILRQATPEFPEARLSLAGFFIRQGAVDQAAAELQAYLKTPDPLKKQAVQCWLAKVTQKPDGGACPASAPKNHR
jgi:tetratricopeptide (TPR) repeat protein